MEPLGNFGEDAAAANLRILLADRHTNVRRALRADLEEAGYPVCAEAADADGALEAALRERPDLCLLDSASAGTVDQIVAGLPDAHVIVLAVARDETGVAQAIAAGATGYLPKDVDVRRLRDVLRQVAAGITVLPHSLRAPFPLNSLNEPL